jgi:hypothetical protein
VKSDLLASTSPAAIGDGRPVTMTSEAARIAELPSRTERQLRFGGHNVATARRLSGTGNPMVRYYLDEAFILFVAVRLVRLSITWPVAIDIARRAVEGVAHYALQNVPQPGSLYIGIPPDSDDPRRPDFAMPADAGSELQTIAGLRQAGVVTIAVPARQLLARFCARATSELGVEVTPQNVLGCYIAGSPDRREDEA